MTACLTHLEALEARYDGPVPPQPTKADIIAAYRARVRVYTDLIKGRIWTLRKIRKAPMTRCARALRERETLGDMQDYRAARRVELRKLVRAAG